MEGKTRQANFEALRILAMLMVVILHYLNKGDVAGSLDEECNGVVLLACFLKAACIAAVNSYVLISGYFLVESQWRFSKLVQLVLQVWVYSAVIPVVCLALGIGDVASWNLYDWSTVIFPLQMEHYWFATAYVIMYIFVPVLSNAVKRMTQKQLQTVIVLLLAFFSVGKSIIPIFVATDKYGYDFGWFICVFLIAAYIRLYGIPFLQNKGRAYLMYFIFVAAIWIVNVVFGFLSRKGLPLSYALDMTLSYNHILVLGASVALFYVFSYIRIPKGILSVIICKIAPYTFGVYLLHENIAVRLLWPGWFGVENVRGSFAFIPHMIITVLVVFLTGLMVDFVRDCFFRMIQKAGGRYETT